MIATAHTPTLDEQRDAALAGVSGQLVATHLRLVPAPSGEPHKFACPVCSSSDALHCYGRLGQGAYCYACGADTIGVVRAARGCRYGDAVRLLENIGNALPLRADGERPTRTRQARGTRPGQDEVQEFWHACRQVGVCPVLRDWLRERAIEVDQVAELDLVRAFPELRHHRVPRWAWTRRKMALVTPLVDERGELRSVRFRPVSGSGRDARGPYDPQGPSYSARGLVMACPLARAMLAEACTDSAPPTLVVCEGEPDWLTWACSAPCSALGYATIAVVAGSWSKALAARVPTSVRVVLATDRDRAGERYADRIARTLPEHDVRRLRPLQLPTPTPEART